MKSGSMKQILIKACSILASLCFLVSMLITLVDVICFNRSFFLYEYEKNNQAQIIGTSDEDLMAATDVLLDYLKDKRDDIAVTAVIDGVSTEVFTTRESMHMVDVKDLYQSACFIRNVTAFICVMIGAVLYWICGTGRVEVYKDGMENGLFMMGCFVLCIGIWAVLDFSDFWMDFHYLFFDNDLFLLDASRSIMINMFPESFFFDLVTAIILSFGGCCGLFYAVIRKLCKKRGVL